MKVRMIGKNGAAAALLALASVAVVGCTSSPSTSIPIIFTPSPLVTATASTPGHSRTASPSGNSSAGRTHSSPGTTASAGAGNKTPSGSGTRTATGSGTKSPSASPSATGTARHTGTPAQTRHATPAASHHPAPSASVPLGAPETGGGGTAGVQDGLLFGIGGAAILAGLGSLAYRRRATRARKPGAPAEPEPSVPADR
jgi:hypothetical protein